MKIVMKFTAIVLIRLAVILIGVVFAIVSIHAAPHQEGYLCTCPVCFPHCCCCDDEPLLKESEKSEVAENARSLDWLFAMSMFW